MNIDLILLGKKQSGLSWALGNIYLCEASTMGLINCWRNLLPQTKADAWLFWDSSLGHPDPEHIQSIASMPGDLWHAGLQLGTGGWPRIMDAVASTWMFNCDPDCHTEATSWRLSFRACLTKTSVLRQMGEISTKFLTLDAAALEWGHRCVTRGVVPRHMPGLINVPPSAARLSLPLEDEVRFVFYRYGQFWGKWAAMRAALWGYGSMVELISACKQVAKETPPLEPSPYVAGPPSQTSLDPEHPPSKKAPLVTVIIPTIGRYPYLRTLLQQLRGQTVRPHEIFVIDQTAVEDRDTALATEFSDLPLKVIIQEQAGQCTSRNAGLLRSSGDYILFIDDDDEVPSDLIEGHLQTLQRLNADVSSGVADEVGAGPLPQQFTLVRASDVFPTNNSMVRRSALERSGLFDLAYDRGQRADGDLGMRLYLSGALMVLNPQLRVLHHHAPSGGLRTHKARVITYASSRSRLNHRQLTSATEFYMAKRYFTARQSKEMAWLAVLGTFSIRGNLQRKLLKLLISAFYLPQTLWRLQKHHTAALRMLQTYPQIPSFRSSPKE